MKNRWKRAFWILFTVFVLMTAFLIYTITDMGITIANLYEGYENTEADLAKISQVIEGRLSREDFDKMDFISRDSLKLELTTINIVFGIDKKVKEVAKK